MLRLKCAVTGLLLVSCVGAQDTQQPAAAQSTQQPAAAPDAQPQPAQDNYRWKLGPITFSGLVDGYYSVGFNHPGSDVNGLRNFDVKANEPALNFAKLTMEHTPDPIGFRFDVGFGRTFDMIQNAGPAPDPFRRIEQVYVSFKPKQAHGLELDFGKFVTSAGAEVIETKDNWNYSRSLLFSWAIPYYHFGLRASMPVGKHVTAGVQLVNGWNNVNDNNGGKTAGFNVQVSAGKFSWANNYYVGPEKADTNQGWRHLYDTTLTMTATSKLSTYINFDYGVDKNIGPGEKRWTGIAGAARYSLSRRFAVAGRTEWFNDADGFQTGTVQKVKEITATGEFTPYDGVLTRLEYRHDFSNAPVFDRGAQPASWDNQGTLLVGVVLYFGPKH